MNYARTKIQAPRPRATFVERGALLQRLTAALQERRLVLLCAPAGYGKTSLLAHALAGLPAGIATAWVSADAGDDLQRLLECALAACEPFDPPWRIAPESLLARAGESQASRSAVAAEVINALDACAVPHGVLAFEDLHRVDDLDFFRFLDVLIERMSARWTIAITSRTEPPLALARLRASGELAEFRQLLLQFSRDEARTLAAAAGVDRQLADRFFERTQGWPAGLRIALEAAATDAARGDADRILRSGERPMFEYLVSEVLDQLPEGLAGFLLSVSVLPELDAARCAVVSGESQAARRLEQIESLGLFVDVLEGPQRLLRLHDLFREALMRRLAQQDPERLATLQRLAATTEPDPVRRIALHREAGDLDAAATLVLNHIPGEMALLGPSVAAHALNRFPREYRERSAELLLVRGLIDWVEWDFKGMLVHMERAQRAFAPRGAADLELFARAFRATALIATGALERAEELLAPLRLRELPGGTRVMALHALIWHAIEDGRYRAVAPLYLELLDVLAGEERLELWYHSSPSNRMPGLPGIDLALQRHAGMMLDRVGDTPCALRSIALLVQAWGAFWRGEFAQARERRELAVEDARWSGSTGAVRGHLLALTALESAAVGDSATAIAAATTRLQEFGAKHSAWGRWTMAMLIARTAAACGDHAALEDALRQARVHRDAAGPVANVQRTRPLVACEAQLAWLGGRPDEAIAGWRAALAHREQIEVFGLATECDVRLARALARRGALGAAASQLRTLLTAAPAGAPPPGVLLAGDALDELASCGWDGALTDAQCAVLRRWRSCLERARADRPVRQAAGSGDAWTRGVTASPKRATLSAREFEVLERIARGEANKEIARGLELSLHTVKRHVANILDKLDLGSRAAAAAWFESNRAGN